MTYQVDWQLFFTPSFMYMTYQVDRQLFFHLIFYVYDLSGWQVTFFRLIFYVYDLSGWQATFFSPHPLCIWPIRLTGNLFSPHLLCIWPIRLTGNFFFTSSFMYMTYQVDWQLFFKVLNRRPGLILSRKFWHLLDVCDGSTGFFRLFFPISSAAISQVNNFLAFVLPVSSRKRFLVHSLYDNQRSFTTWQSVSLGHTAELSQHQNSRSMLPIIIKNSWSFHTWKHVEKEWKLYMQLRLCLILNSDTHVAQAISQLPRQRHTVHLHWPLRTCWWRWRWWSGERWHRWCSWHLSGHSPSGGRSSQKSQPQPGHRVEPCIASM